MIKQPVVGLVGPTASGKTALSLMLAREYPIEIICMDSMQVYKGMDIGTAKPGKEEQSLIPHHMLDVASPHLPYDVSQYVHGALDAILGIQTRNHLPVLVGGTGLYLRALSRGLSLGNTPKVDSLREKYENMLTQIGSKALHECLQSIDPVTAARLHPNDTRRVIRALEVYDATGRPFSAQQLPEPENSPYQFLLYGVDYQRELLYHRIDLRVNTMIAQGLILEVQKLLSEGVTPDMQSMQGLGYKELVPYLEGRSTLTQSTEVIKRRTRNYAKRQLTWFRPDNRIRWLSPDSIETHFLPLLREDLTPIEH